LKQRELTPEDISEFLINMRSAIGASQDEFSRMISISPDSLRRYERCERTPRYVEDFCERVRAVVREEIRRKRSQGIPIGVGKMRAKRTKISR
jgi:transcriptional regulator with XRE-family HTH domain